MTKSTWKSKRACMDCHKRVYLQTNYSKNVWRDTDTSNNRHPIWFNLCVNFFGIKYIGREHLQHLYDAQQKKHTQLLKIWKVTSIAALFWDGTMQNPMLILLWWSMLWNNSQNTVTSHLWNHNTARICQTPSSMKKNRHLPHLMTVPYWMKQERNESNKLSAAFYIMHEQSILLY